MADGNITTRNYQRLRKIFRAECESNNAPCWLCGMPIDYSVEWPHADAFELDHFYPRSTHPELTEDRGNFRPSHRACNNERSNTSARDKLGTLTRQWII